MKIYHAVFTGDTNLEGFITDDADDANWTASGKGAMFMDDVPTIGHDIREGLDDKKAQLPHKYALVFETEAQAVLAYAALAEAGFDHTPTPSTDGGV